MSSIFPFIDTEVYKDKETTSLPLFKEYAYDFENKSLKLKDGKTYLVEGNEALKIWIYFTLLTARYAYTAHSRNYGCEINSLIGQNMSDGIVQSEAERFITEAIMVNPYIEEISDFDFDNTTDKLALSFSVKTIYGEERMEYSLERGN